MLLKPSNSWQKVLSSEFTKEYYSQLMDYLVEEYRTETIYPPKEEIFTALEWTPFEEVKVVILGQDPYHGPNQAHGLSFSVLPGTKIPPSLVNIYKELENDLGLAPASHGYLETWAKQGVLLLNTVLTVRQAQPNSHQQKGWELVTDKVIEALNEREESVIFILWGKPAQTKINMITADHHIILTAPHPSPLAAYRGFFGSAPFSKVNSILQEKGQQEIDWQLPKTV